MHDNADTTLIGGVQMSKPLEPHDMRYKTNKQKMYGTVANRDAVHKVSQESRKETQTNGRKTEPRDPQGQTLEGK